MQIINPVHLTLLFVDFVILIIICCCIFVFVWWINRLIVWSICHIDDWFVEGEHLTNKLDIIVPNRKKLINLIVASVLVV